MSGTRAELVRLLRQSGSATVRQLAEALGLTRACVHTHLVKMLEAGLVRRLGTVRRGRGRPGFLYQLTQDSDALFPKDYAGLACHLLGAVKAIHGRMGLRAVLEARNEELLARWQVGEKGDERLEEHALRLTELGYEASAGDGELALRNCPVPEAARHYPEVCAAESRFHERVLGVKTRRVGKRLVDGGACCLYRLGASRRAK